MRSVSANNHQGQDVKNIHKQAGYMRAMIPSHIKDQNVLQSEWVHICRRYDPKEEEGRAKQDDGHGRSCRGHRMRKSD